MDNLILYLEHRVVTHQGEIHESTFDQAERTALEEWHESRLIYIEKLPVAERAKKETDPNAQPATHRIRFSKQMFDYAHQLRIEKAERESSIHSQPVKQNSDNTQLFTLPEMLIFAAAHNISLYEVQVNQLEDIINAFNKPRNRALWSGKQTGKTFLLKFIDQYVTSAHGKRKKILEKTEARTKKLNLWKPQKTNND